MSPFLDPKHIVQMGRLQGLNVRGLGTQALFLHDQFEGRMVLAQPGNEAFRGLAFAIIFLRTSLLHNGCGPQRKHFPHIRTDNRCAQHLVGIRDGTMAMDLLPTRGAVPGLRGKIPCAIECQAGVPNAERHQFERLASLQLPKDPCAHGTSRLGTDRIKYLAPGRVARNTREAIDRVQMTLSPLCIIGEQRRRLAGKHGACRHQGIRQGHRGIATAMIRDGVKAASPHAKEGLGGEILASFGAKRGPWHTPHEHNQSFQSGGIFALMFPKRHLGGCRDDRGFSLAGNCWRFPFDMPMPFW
jgi:hypothetical protein